MLELFLIELPVQKYTLEGWTFFLTSSKFYFSLQGDLWRNLIPGILFGGLSWSYYKDLKATQSRVYTLLRLSMWLWAGLHSILLLKPMIDYYDIGLVTLLLLTLGWLLGRTIRLRSEMFSMLVSIIAFGLLILQQILLGIFF